MDTYQIEGRNPVVESLESEQKPIRIFLESNINKDSKILKIITLADKFKIELKFVNKKKLNQMSRTHVHQGVIAVKQKPEDQTLNGSIDSLISKKIEPFVIVIRETLYEHNLGAIIRTAECAGANIIVVTPKTDISPQVIRAAMGATEHIPVIKSSFFQTLKILSEKGIKICAIEVNAEKFYFEEDLTGSIALVIGGEDRPLTQSIQQKTDICVKIPLQGKINSLNMSVAAAIVIFEKVKQEYLLQNNNGEKRK